jgi:hypothetical protein
MSTWHGYGLFMATKEANVTVSPYLTSPVFLTMLQKRHAIERFGVRYECYGSS